MVHRKAFPPAHDWVNGLNLIDVVFSDTPKVVALWHQYYSMLGSAKNDNEYRDRDHKYIELLSAMARDLGYQNLPQTDIDKFYSPQAHQNQIAASNEIQTELLRVLKNTQNIAIVPKREEQMRSIFLQWAQILLSCLLQKAQKSREYASAAEERRYVHWTVSSLGV
jgi:predicted RNA-binding protein YlxR (DUF448 family)